MAEPNQPQAVWSTAAVAAKLRSGAPATFGAAMRDLQEAAPTTDGANRFKLTMEDGQEFWVEVKQMNKEGV